MLQVISDESMNEMLGRGSLKIELHPVDIRVLFFYPTKPNKGNYAKFLNGHPPMTPVMFSFMCHINQAKAAS